MRSDVAARSPSPRVPRPEPTPGIISFYHRSSTIPVNLCWRSPRAIGRADKHQRESQLPCRALCWRGVGKGDELMTRSTFAVLPILLTPAPAHAQYWGPPYRDWGPPYRGYYMRPYPGYYGNYGTPPDWGGRGWDEDEASPYQSPFVQSGGE